MGFRRSDLQEAFFVPGAHGFRAWGYSTGDVLEDVLRPDYFHASGLLQPGELIYVRMQAQPPLRLRRPEPAPVRMALLMVTGASARGAAAVRLVQDLGRSDAAAEVPAGAAAALRAAPAAAPAAPAEAPRRQRGRPAGSRSRKLPATNGHVAGPPATDRDDAGPPVV